jgi:hypothetical protein
MDNNMIDKFKKWYDRNKQKIILLLGMTVVLILIFGLIIRGVLSIQSNTSTEERVATEDISFDIVAETPQAQGETDEKLYQERLANTQDKTTPEDVKISFDAIFVPEAPTGEIPSPVAHSSQVPGTTASYSPAPGLNAREKTAIQQELDAIYNPQSQNKPDDNVTDESQTEPPRPLTKDEILARQKKLMEEGFNISDLADPVSTESDAAVYITSPSEIPAFIHGPQTVMVGNRLALRIDTSVTLSNGQIIPRNAIIYAQIALNNNRVQVTVESIKFGAAIYSLELSGYSEDGSPGLPVQNDQNQKIVGDASSSAAASAIDRKISTVTGGLVGSVVRDISNAGRSRKETYVSFFDNQKVFLRPGLPK